MRIGDLETLKQFFKRSLRFPLFGAGVYAFHRLGPEEFVPDYRILALRFSSDTELIEKDVEVISLEKGMGTMHIPEPRNATTVLKHGKIKSYLSRFSNPAILVYKTSRTMERLAQKNGWTLIQNPVYFGKSLFENKIVFRKILGDLDISPPPGETVQLMPGDASDDTDISRRYREWESRYGLPFVVQHPTRGGGKGTFFIHCEDDAARAFKKILREETPHPQEKQKPVTLVIAKFIQGPSPSITGCVTRHGILSTNLQHQILDSPDLYNPAKGSGLFCGHDWSSASFPAHINDQAYAVTDRIGKYLRQTGYKGVFGIDFVLDDMRGILYPTECNARLLGSFPSLTMVQLRSDEPPILAFHILEFLNLNYEIDVKEINRLMRAQKTGAQMILHNLSQKWAKNHGELRAGVYRFNGLGGNLPHSSPLHVEFVRPGYKLSHISKQNEFLITEGVPFKKSHFSPNRRLVRILAIQRLLDVPPNRLTAWAQTVAHLVYQYLDMRPIRFVRIRKLLNPDVLAKG